MNYSPVCSLAEATKRALAAMLESLRRCANEAWLRWLARHVASEPTRVRSAVRLIYGKAPGFIL
jgi:hypothetical protein